MFIICFYPKSFWKDAWFPKWWEERVLVECMQFHGWQVSTLVHANKMARVRRDKVPLHSTRLSERIWSLSSMTNPTPVENLGETLWLECLCLILRNPMHVTPAYKKLVLNSGKSLYLYRKTEWAYTSIPCSEAVAVKPSCDCRTSFWKACVGSPVGIVETTQSLACERLPPGERVCMGRRELLEGTL